MSKVHGPAFSRATLVYVAAAGAYLYSRLGSHEHAKVALMVVAMVAGPVALLNFASIMWGSFKIPRSVPMFLLELAYSALIPAAFFIQHIRHFIK